MAQTTAHPRPEHLSAFALGKLDEASANSVLRHLETCPDCAAAAASISPDSFLGKVKAAKPSDPPLPNRTMMAVGGASSPPRPAPAAPPADVPPELANHPRYRILKELGRGGMGVVYHAMQTKMDREVGIKVISRAVLGHPEALDRFRREVRAVAKLSHPNIVLAYDTDTIGDLEMLIMEFVPGLSLDKVVRAKGPLPIAHACSYIRQAALGLQHAFEAEMIHRDIKPQNLMLTPKGQVKILDFGLARLASERGKGKVQTVMGAYMGTPEYCAPEQAADASKADIRADLYSLGCTLYFLLTGRPVFERDTDVNTILAHIQDAPPDIRELRADVPAALADVLTRLLAKDPTQRYQTPVEVAQALVPFCKPGAKSGPVPTVPLETASAQRGTMMGRDTSKPSSAVKPPKTKMPAKQDDNAAISGSGQKGQKPSPASGGRGRRGVPLIALAAAGAAAVLLIGIIIVIKISNAKGESTEITIKFPPDKQDPQAEEPSKKANEPANAPKVADDDRAEEKKSGNRDRAVAEEPSKKANESANAPRVADDDRAEEKKSGNRDRAGEGDGFVPLFNGKDLTGWERTPSEIPAEWTIEGDALVGRNRNLNGSGRVSYLATKRSDYANFHLRFEMMACENSTTAFAFRGKLMDKNDRWTGYAVFNLGTNLDNAALKKPTGSLCILRHGKPPELLQEAPDLPLEPGKWIPVEVRAEGNVLKCTVAGHPLPDYTDKENRFDRGFIGIMCRPESTVRFRKIEIKETRSDRLQVGSIWEGVHKHIRAEERGYMPPKATLKVLEREGNEFKALFEIHAGVNRQLREVKGTVNGNLIKWFAKDVKVMVGHEGHDNVGELEGEEIKLRYSGNAKSDGKPTSGVVELRLVSGSVVAPMAHSLSVGSVWKGNRTYRKGAYAPGTVTYELHISEREGAKFKGHVFDSGAGRNRAEVEGEVDGQNLTWRERSIYRNNELQMRGKLDGDTIRLTFTGRYQNGATNEGAGELQRAK